MAVIVVANIMIVFLFSAILLGALPCDLRPFYDDEVTRNHSYGKIPANYKIVGDANVFEMKDNGFVVVSGQAATSPVVFVVDARCKLVKQYDDKSVIAADIFNDRLILDEWAGIRIVELRRDISETRFSKREDVFSRHAFLDSHVISSVGEGEVWIDGEKRAQLPKGHRYAFLLPYRENEQVLSSPEPGLETGIKELYYVNADGKIRFEAFPTRSYYCMTEQCQFFSDQFDPSNPTGMWGIESKITKRIVATGRIPGPSSQSVSDTTRSIGPLKKK